MRGASCEPSSRSGSGFARALTACRVTDLSVDPRSAYEECFCGVTPNHGDRSAELVTLPELSAGDYVLANVDEIARVIVNQHREPCWAIGEEPKVVPMLRISYVDVGAVQGGSHDLRLTPNQVIHADGEFIAAAAVSPGAALRGNLTVVAVIPAIDSVVNPLTTTGTILVAPDGGGAPVLASTYPDWIAAYLLAATCVPLPFSLCNMFSHQFPTATQASRPAREIPHDARVIVDVTRGCAITGLLRRLARRRDGQRCLLARHARVDHAQDRFASLPSGRRRDGPIARLLLRSLGRCEPHPRGAIRGVSDRDVRHRLP